MKPSEIIDAIEDVLERGLIYADGNDLGDPIVMDSHIEKLYPDLDGPTLFDSYCEEVDRVVPGEVRIENVWRSYLDRQYEIVMERQDALDRFLEKL